MRFTVFWTVIKHEVDSLELRRIRCDLVCVYKLLFDMVDAEVPALFVANNVDTVTRGHSLKLFVVYSSHALMPVNTFFSQIVLYRVGIVCRPH